MNISYLCLFITTSIFIIYICAGLIVCVKEKLLVKTITGSGEYNKNITDIYTDSISSTNGFGKGYPVYGVEKSNDLSGIDFFYDQISPEDRFLYNFLIDLINNRNTPGYSKTIVFKSDKSMINAKTNEILTFIKYDHPEYFFIYDDYRRISYESLLNTRAHEYLITYTISDGDPNEHEQIKQFDKATKEFLKDIDMNAPPEIVELQIHDKLISLVSYDTYSSENPENYLGYTSYGALVCNDRNEYNKAVCTGYSKAFQHLLKKSGIKCTTVCGTVGTCNNEGQWLNIAGDHMWNMVYIYDQWYEVDCTWDDQDLQISYPDLYMNFTDDIEAYAYYTHYYFNVTTDELKYRIPDHSNDFDINGDKYCLLDETRHERMSFDNYNTLFCSAMWDLLPYAEGKDLSFDYDKYNNQK